MSINITKYNIICNIGKNIDEVYEKAIEGDTSCFDYADGFIKNKKVRVGKIKTELFPIDDEKYDLRCNKMILKCLESFDLNSLFTKYGRENIAVVVATTNTGVEEFDSTQDFNHSKLSNPAEFVKNYYKLNNFYTSISTACSSGIKAFSLARNLLNSNYAKSVIVIGIDSLTKVPIFGFDSLGVLSPTPTIPFSKNRTGINIGEGVGCFILEKDIPHSIEVAGIGETTDVYHMTTPDENGVEAINSIKKALEEALLKPLDIDYINLHGTGTIANDLMEAKAINVVFGTNVLSSSTKPLTGHCLGAAAVIEIALCCKLLDKQENRVYPHIYDNKYDESISKIKLATKKDTVKKLENCLCTSFGFGGTNTSIILKRGNNE